MGAGITRSSPPCAHLCVDGGIRPAGPPIRSPRPMRRDEIDQDLRNLAFDFFYWFSRFEFAMKERRFLKTAAIGARAKPDWDKFVQKHRAAYALSPAAQALLGGTLSDKRRARNACVSQCRSRGSPNVNKQHRMIHREQ